MNAEVEHHGKFIHPHRAFTIFKWVIYCLLVVDGWFFLQEDLTAAVVMFEGEVTLENFLQIFSAAVDTLAWIVLLLAFEFETAIIPDEILKGWLSWFLLGLKTICYVLIVFAFYGYCVEFLAVSNVVPAIAANACDLADQGWNYVVNLDEYPALTAESCQQFQGQPLLQVAGTELVGTAEAMGVLYRVAMIDIINAGTWILVVLMLQAEVLMQLWDVLTDRLIRIGAWVKGVLYSILFVCAVWWGIDGDFLDFWDAFLWLVAFIFIELNIFTWHEEVEEMHQLEAAEAQNDA